LLRRVALVRTTRRNNPEDTILHSHRRENLKSYNKKSRPVRILKPSTSSSLLDPTTYCPVRDQLIAGTRNVYGSTPMYS
jgi:hypothetical protein